MRENKFRVWDNAEKRMLSHSDLIVLDQETMCIYTALTDKRFLRENEWTKMQYTGLKDKNGVEIHEGDILNVLEVDEVKGILVEKKYVTSVVWKDYGFLVEEDNGTQVPLFLLDGSKDWVGSDIEIKIIGNIYDNPELLEVQHG